MSPTNPRLPAAKQIKIKPLRYVEKVAMSISIAKGLKSSHKNARDYTLAQTFLELEKYTNNYEVLKPDFNRVYGDIDGKDIDLPQAEFEKLDSETRAAIEKFLEGQKYCLLTASSFAHKKISWRFVLTNKKTTLQINKQWVKQSIETIALPKGISFDSAPYNKNQKIRMLRSNKDGENRPLKLVVGEEIDTLISYIPDDCTDFVLSAEEAKETKKEKESQTKSDCSMNPILLRRLVMNITNDENTTWEQWYKVAQAIYNEGGDLDLFLAWSEKSPKHNEREAIKQFASLRDGGDGVKLTGKSLFYWSALSDLEEHERIILEQVDPDQYEHKKILFEREHFKLKNPVCYVRELTDGIQVIKSQDLGTLYQNLYCSKGVFVKAWVKDPAIRTYEKVVFKPNQEVNYGEYNLFKGFLTPAVPGDCSVMNNLLWHLSGKSEEVKEYLENYFAHMIQKPHVKPKVCLVFMTEKQGAGKDTFLDALGRILGSDYFFNTNDPTNMVFGRFTGHLQKTILLKMEEADFDTNKKNESLLLSLITASSQSYEGKGKEALLLDDYKRIVMTTNKSTPVNVPESDRRFCLINCSEDLVGNRDFWNTTYRELEKPETLQAYHHFLATKDISNFDVQDRPKTDYYREVKLTLRPYHASFFQRWLSVNGEVMEEEERSATEWLRDLNVSSKFSITATKFGRDMKAYEESGAITKRHTKFAYSYTVHTNKMYECLKAKGWWAEV